MIDIKLVLELLGSALAIYVLIIVLMYSFQNRLMYFPDRTMGKPEEYGFKDIQVLSLNTRDNIKVTAWYFPAAGDQYTIVYFHGNRGHVADRAQKLSAFLNRGFGLLALSYRGYGTSEGKPGEQGFYNDSRAAIDYLAASGVPLDKTIIYGESLGTGIATQMATEYDIRALILEAPYTSVVGRAAEIYRWIPVRKLIKDRFESIGKIKSVKAPVLIMHGERDLLIPVRHGKELLAAANDPKKGVFFSEVSHVDFDPEKLAGSIVEFLEETKN